MTPLLRNALVLLVVIGAGTAGYLTQSAYRAPDTERTVPAEAGAPILALTLPDTTGRHQPLSQWKGRILVANFWATWCPPCLKEIPDFAEVSRHFKDAPVQFVGISIDRPDSVITFAREKNVPYPLLIATPQHLGLTAALGNTAQALPFTAIFAPDGSLDTVRLGTLNRDELEGKIRALLAKE